MVGHLRAGLLLDEGKEVLPDSDRAEENSKPKYFFGLRIGFKVGNFKGLD